jgi:hypothetical protein
MASRREVAQPSLIDLNQVADDAAAVTGTLGRAASTANIATGRQGVSAGLRDLQDDAWALANPKEAKALREYMRRNKITPKMLANQQTLTDRLNRLQGFLDSGEGPDGKPLTDAQRKKFESTQKKVSSRLDKLTTTIDTRTQQVDDYTTKLRGDSPDTGATAFREADPEFYANVDRAQGIADTIGQVTPEGQAFLDAAGRGYTAGTISAQNVNAAQMGPIGNVSAQQISAPTMGNFGRANATRISAGQVGTGTLGQSLMQRALSGIARGGRLNEQASRDAIQSARQAFAARGLATGGAAIGAELLNRDRYARQREMEDLAFASGVQGQDLGRQFQNVGNQLAAAQSNQQAAMQAELANLQARYNAAVQQGNWQQAAALANQSATLEADRANQTTAFNVGQANMGELNRVNMFNSDANLRAQGMQEDANRVGTVTNNEMLYNAAAYGDALKGQGLGASLQMAGVQQAANPLFRALSFDPYGTRGSGTNALATGSGLAGNVASFNTNMQGSLYNSYMNNQAALEAARITGGAANQAGWMNMIGGLSRGAGDAAGGIFSDKRMKKDIKQTGRDGVLGLKTYEYRFKGESTDAPKRTGFMAQEVRQVMPEAVEEVDYRGKKRLAIKPRVIGMALAQALAAEQDAMFDQGYTVGRGFGR